MTWRHLLFAHLPVPAEALRPHVPESLDIDLYDNTAWLGVVPFLMDRTRPRCLPGVPTTTTFPELNLRTYVTPKNDRQTPGVWFFSLDAASRLAVAVARGAFHLPYFNADMKIDASDSQVRYLSARTDRRAPEAKLDVTYAPAGPLLETTPDSLEHFLTERYCLYAACRNRLYAGHIHHAPWGLHAAQAEFRACKMTALLNISLPKTDPILHTAESIDVVAWALKRVRSSGN